MFSALRCSKRKVSWSSTYTHTLSLIRDGGHACLLPSCVPGQLVHIVPVAITGEPSAHGIDHAGTTQCRAFVLVSAHPARGRERAKPLVVVNVSLPRG